MLLSDLRSLILLDRDGTINAVVDYLSRTDQLQLLPGAVAGLRRLGQAGFPKLWAALASAALFGIGHGYQGIIGIVSGSLLGLFFAWRWYDSSDIHEIAIGHGLFDAAVFALAVYT